MQKKYRTTADILLEQREVDQKNRKAILDKAKAEIDALLKKANIHLRPYQGVSKNSQKFLDGSTDTCYLYEITDHDWELTFIVSLLLDPIIAGLIHNYGILGKDKSYTIKAIIQARNKVCDDSPYALQTHSMVAKHAIGFRFKTKSNSGAFASAKRWVTANEDSLIADEAKQSIVESHLINNSNRKNMVSFKEDLKMFLMETAIGVIFDKIILDEMGDEVDYEIGHSIIRNFINEEGYDNIIRKFSKKNLLLSEMARYCEVYKDAILESVVDKIKSNDNNDLCYTMNAEIAKDFVDKCQDLIPARTILLIKARVADSITDFMNQNAENKASIMDIYNKANQSIEDPNNTMSEAAVVDKKRLAKNEASKIYDKPTNVFGAIVRTLSESVLKNKELRNSYMLEDNHLDMKRITNESAVIYTVLEELNTMQMVDMTPQYIKKVISDLS